ncbi:MAG: dihydropteroate synthase [Planctomycetes bacterium]|nr:dihydropteroate synthase [Planctomycetota bacterium]
MNRTIHLSQDRFLSLGEKTLVMGVLNCTPDSFSDGGLYGSVENAVAAATRMVEDGVDIIDVGGESTRPGSLPVSEEVEIGRVVPVIEALRKTSDIPISIDTNKSGVAFAALKAGADIVNDIAALGGDEKMGAVAAESGCPVILMHMKGTPENMQAAPCYSDIVAEVSTFLLESAKKAEKYGVARENIILDPGFGFGKTFRHNAILLERLDEIFSLGYPVLAGMSRKSMIQHALGLPVEERLEASLALAVMAALRGASIIRVHDVKESVRALGMIDAVRTEAGKRI